MPPVRAFLADGCGKGLIEVGVAAGEDAFVAEFVEKHFGQFGFAGAGRLSSVLAKARSC